MRNVALATHEAVSKLCFVGSLSLSLNSGGIYAPMISRLYRTTLRLFHCGLVKVRLIIQSEFPPPCTLDSFA